MLLNVWFNLSPCSFFPPKPCVWCLSSWVRYDILSSTDTTNILNFEELHFEDIISYFVALSQHTQAEWSAISPTGLSTGLVKANSCHKT